MYDCIYLESGVKLDIVDSTIEGFYLGRCVTAFGDINLIRSGVMNCGNGTVHGGGVKGCGGSRISIISSHFRNNIGEAGAAVEADSFSTLTISHSKFSENVATNTGAAIQAYWAASLFVKDTEFIQNESNTNGGIIEVFNTDAVVMDNTFLGNTAAGTDNVVRCGSYNRRQHVLRYKGNNVGTEKIVRTPSYEECQMNWG